MKEFYTKLSSSFSFHRQSAVVKWTALKRIRPYWVLALGVFLWLMLGVIPARARIAALCSLSDFQIAARYEYGPFGEIPRATDPMAKNNPFRFPTKYCDDESGLVYYGHRYYSPSLGRFINRDPAEEQGGNNLYRYNINNPIILGESLGKISGCVDNNRFRIHDIVIRYVVLNSGIATAMQATSHAAGIAEEYGRALKQGDTPMADLAVIDIVIAMQEGVSKCCMGCFVLGILLQ